MPSRAQLYTKEISKRLAIFGVCILMAFGLHRLFSSVHLEIPGAVIFIVGFSLGAMYYYFNLFRTSVHETEFILSIIFIFVLTVTMLR